MKPSQKCLLAQYLCWYLVSNPQHTIVASGLRPTGSIRSDGESRTAGKRGPVARVTAKPLGEDGILNQNPILDTASGEEDL